ncbi:MAG: ribosome maturation factor RimM [Bacteroidota bacterium]|nr:ribosome maturation factor RimM [Bacteroidota bacterium]
MSVPDTKFILLGKIVKAHGYGGSVMISPEDDLAEEIKEKEWVFIEIEAKPVPFFVTSVKEHASGNIILKFDGYDSSEVMTEFVGCKVFISKDYIRDEKEIPPQFILAGFKIFNQSNKYIGLVKKVMSLPMQYMMVLEDDEGHELLIPLNQDWLIEINKDEKNIIMDLPDGLVQINE